MKEIVPEEEGTIKYENLTDANHEMVRAGIDWYALLLMLLTGALGFVLGWYSYPQVFAPRAQSELSNFTMSTSSANQKLQQPKLAQHRHDAFVASKHGTRYYPVNCAAAKRIKEQNRVYFKASTEAEAAGYSRATSC